MNLSKTAEYVISLCWEGEQPRATNFIIGNTYELDGKNVKATEELYNEILEYQKVSPKSFRVQRFGNIVNLIGLKSN